MLSIRRHDAATHTDYYFFYNQGIASPPDEPRTLFEPATGEPVEREFSLEGAVRPFLLDAWSGKITPIADYKSGAGRVTFRVRLSRDNGMLLALTDRPGRFGVLRTPAPGSALSRPIELTAAKWHLTAEDWQPAHPYSSTLGVAASETMKERVELELSGLRPWPEIPALKNASGIGTYSTTFDLPASWKRGAGVRLSLGEVFDTFTVSVNGQAVILDQLAAEGEIGPYLKPGGNNLVVRVATTLNNRLASLDEEVRSRGLVQPYGLVGPVRLATPPRRPGE